MQLLVNELQPRRIIPVHTNHPEKYEDLFNGIPVTVAEDGVLIKI